MSKIYFENVANYKRVQYIADNIKCENGKDIYLTAADAYRALERRSKSRKEKKAVYRCSICGYYHLHSKDGVSKRHIKYSRIQDKKKHGSKKFIVSDELLRVARIIEDRRRYPIF